MLHIEKDKLPKGYGYALKTSSFEKALHDAEIDFEKDIDISLNYWSTPHHNILSANYSLQNDNDSTSWIFISSNPIPSQSLKHARELLEETVLPEFTNWLTELESLPNNSTKRMNTQIFDASYENGQIKMESYQL